MNANKYFYLLPSFVIALVYMHQNFLKVVVHVIIIYQRNQTACQFEQVNAKNNLICIPPKVVIFFFFFFGYCAELHSKHINSI